jgi:predicted TIM-barrel fold metal-dependent hydrolase
MDCVDAFRFSLERASERDLFDLSNQNMAALPLPQGCRHALYALFDSEVITRGNQAEAIRKATASNRASFSYLAPLDQVDAEERISEAARLGIKALVLHPYLQNIVGARLERAIVLASVAEKLGLFVQVCTAYGSRQIYAIRPLDVALAVAEAVNCPVVLTHGGGAKVLDALLIADALPNVVLDTSFSLSWWLGSRIEDDFAFAMRKLGLNRWMYGSDAPFKSFEQSTQDHMSFLSRHGFSDSECEALMSTTAAKLLGISL